jgi:hypothetical protein
LDETLKFLSRRTAQGQSIFRGIHCLIAAWIVFIAWIYLNPL